MTSVNDKVHPTFLHHRAFQWIGKRRGEWTVAIATLVIVDASLERDVRPMSLVAPTLSPRWALSWLLILTGVFVRVWAAGNLRKKAEVTMTGIYVMVRHPLYLGTFLIYLGAFLALGNLHVGGPAILLMMLVVYYPRIHHEEAFLLAKFPERADQYKRTPLLFPNPLLFPLAIRTDKFSISKAAENVGLRSLWALVLIPLVLEAVIWIRAR